MASGCATSLSNYVAGQLAQPENDLSISHVLAHLPTRTTFEQLLGVALAV